MKRKITDFLIKWKNSPNRKPLLIYGARQTGKTYAVNEFGKEHFEDMIYINFEVDTRLALEFENNISPQHIINSLELFFGRKIMPEKTLIFFDEIQTCERALTALKYFCEEAPQYCIIAAGSLLGVAVNRKKHSFPVGKVEIKTLYPMDFEEFLTAVGMVGLAEKIRGCFETDSPIETLLHEKSLELYRSYLVLGGMPEAVASYAKNGGMLASRNIQSLILDAYIADMAKYATPAETARIIACYGSIPVQLAKDNKKFQYKTVQKGGRASFFGASLDWLAASGIINICNKTEQGNVPLETARDLASFKVYMSDTGLLTLKSGTMPNDILSGHSPYIGAITENYAAQSLKASGYELYYWASQSTAEVDFVIQREGKNIPVEVKSSDHTKSRSLSIYMERYKPEYAIRISAKNFGRSENIKAVPLYAVFCV